MVQAWGVLPALALVYLIAAPGWLHRRIGHVVLAGAVTVAVSMWWIVMVLLTPASARPYVDGSQDNSPLAMVFEYNLLSRYGVGSDTTVGFAGPDAHGAWAFMIGDSVAPQVGWLYPLALIGLIVGVWCRGRAPRTDLVRAGFLMWALWFVVHAVAFSTGRVAHTFYVIAVAPALAALAGGGLVVLWRVYRRGGWQQWFLPLAEKAVSTPGAGRVGDRGAGRPGSPYRVDGGNHRQPIRRLGDCPRRRPDDTARCRHTRSWRAGRQRGRAPRRWPSAWRPLRQGRRTATRGIRRWRTSERAGSASRRVAPSSPAG